MGSCYFAKVLRAVQFTSLVLFASLASTGGRATYGQVPEAERDSEKLRRLAYGFLANRQALSEFVWEFEVARCVADSVEDARNHRLTERYVLDGIWAVRGEAVRFELVCPSIEMEHPAPNDIQPGQWAPVECMSHRYLFDGRIRLSDAPALRSANIVPDQGGPELVETPFAAGSMASSEKTSPGNAILKVLSDGVIFKELSDQWVVRYLGKEEREGRMLDVVEVGLDPKKITLRWFLDPSQGFLPLETWYLGGSDSPRAKMFVTDVRQAENGSFYPHVAVRVSHSHLDPPYRTDVYRTRSLRIGRPTDEELTLELAPRTNVIDIRDMRRSVSSPESRTIGLDDLEPLLDECLIGELLLQREVERNARNHSWLILLNVVLIFALIAAAFFYKRRTSRLP